LSGERIHSTVVDISDRKRAEEQIEFHAYHDVLTHLPNRKLFMDRLSQALTRCRRYGKSLSVMFVDLDHFKSINDTFGHTAGHDAETLLRNADSAMYRAKEAGRNTYQLCTDEMKRRAVERLSLESRLRRAVHDGELLLHYQPQVSLITGKVIAVEALVRWNDPERGLVHPSSFIPLAEESRLIVPLGEWVLRTACEQMRSWRDC